MSIDLVVAGMGRGQYSPGRLDVGGISIARLGFGSELKLTPWQLEPFLYVALRVLCMLWSSGLG